MELSRALEIYKFKTVDEINISEIKKRYRRLLKSNHPDNGCEILIPIDEIKEAKNELERFLDFKARLEAEAFRKRQIFIDIPSLITLYKDKEVVCFGDKIVRSDISNDNTYLAIGYSIRVNSGAVDNSVVYVKYNINDNYVIDLDIPVMNNKAYIDLTIGGQVKRFEAVNSNILTHYRYSYNIDLRVNIRFRYKL